MANRGSFGSIFSFILTKFSMNLAAAGLEAALEVVCIGLTLVDRATAVRGVRTHEENGEWALLRVQDDEARRQDSLAKG